MEILWFTLVAIVLYLAADAALRAIEARAGRTLEYRSVIFLGVLMGLALISFALIRHFTGA
jgi:hypothetical protein